MKSNYFLKSLLIIAIVFSSSCSKDDETDVKEPEPTQKKYISSVIQMENGSLDFRYEHKFFYNADATIKEIVWESYLNESRNEIVTYKLYYDANKRVNKVDFYSSENEDPTAVIESIEIQYGNDGYINQYNDRPVSYNISTKTYTLTPNGNIHNYVFNDDYDMMQFHELSMQFDTEKKGPGFNRSQQNDFMFVTRLFLGTELIQPLSKRPVTNTSNPFFERIFLNEYDDEGYLIKSLETTSEGTYEFIYVNL